MHTVILLLLFVLSACIRSNLVDCFPQTQTTTIRATFLILLKDDQSAKTDSLSQVERQFNRHYHYPLQVYQEGNISPQSVADIASRWSGHVYWHNITFQLPSWIDPSTVPKSVRGFSGRLSSLGYRHMCRFYSGLIFMHPSLELYDFSFRIDDDASFLCPIEEDFFEYALTHNVKYGYQFHFTETPPLAGDTLWKETNEYCKLKNIHPDHLEEYQTVFNTYNRVHYWNNFEIVDLRFFKSDTYLDFFNYLDRTGGFYYYRWGDALVRTLATALFLKQEEIHRFSNIGYKHYNYCNDPCNADSGCEVCPNGYCQDTRPNSLYAKFGLGLALGYYSLWRWVFPFLLIQLVIHSMFSISKNKIIILLFLVVYVIGLFMDCNSFSKGSTDNVYHVILFSAIGYPILVYAKRKTIVNSLSIFKFKQYVKIAPLFVFIYFVLPFLLAELRLNM